MLYLNEVSYNDCVGKVCKSKSSDVETDGDTEAREV